MLSVLLKSTSILKSPIFLEYNHDNGCVTFYNGMFKKTSLIKQLPMSPTLPFNSYLILLKKILPIKFIFFQCFWEKTFQSSLY